MDKNIFCSFHNSHSQLAAFKCWSGKISNGSDIVELRQVKAGQDFKTRLQQQRAQRVLEVAAVDLPLNSAPEVVREGFASVAAELCNDPAFGLTLDSATDFDKFLSLIKTVGLRNFSWCQTNVRPCLLGC